MIMLTLAQSTGADDWFVLWGFLLLAAAIGFLVLELFVPSGGVIGALSAICVIGSAAAFFKHDTTWGWAATTSYVLFGPVVIYFGFRFWLNSPFAEAMILGDATETDKEEASVASEQARHERLAALRDLIGTEGRTATALRPVGTVVIQGQRIDALAESGVIEPDVPVVVVDVYDNQIKVRPA